MTEEESKTTQERLWEPADVFAWRIRLIALKREAAELKAKKAALYQELLDNAKPEVMEADAIDPFIARMESKPQPYLGDKPFEVVDIVRDDGEAGWSRTLTRKTGIRVRIRPCAKEFGDKTYFGVLIGDMIFSPSVSYSSETRILKLVGYRNPAIWVPELKRVFFGCESWWGVDESAPGGPDLNKSVLELLSEGFDSEQIVAAIHDHLRRPPPEPITDETISEATAAYIGAAIDMVGAIKREASSGSADPDAG